MVATFLRNGGKPEGAVEETTQRTKDWEKTKCRREYLTAEHAETIFSCTILVNKCQESYLLDETVFSRNSTVAQKRR